MEHTSEPLAVCRDRPSLLLNVESRNSTTSRDSCIGILPRTEDGRGSGGGSQTDVPRAGVRVGERVIGTNKVWFNGKCITGPEYKMSLTAFSLIIIPCLIFDLVTIPLYCQWFSNNEGPAVAVGLVLPSLLLQIICLVCFFSTVCADPGIIPRERNPLNSYDMREHPPPKHQDIVINGHLFKLKYCNIYRAPRTVHCSVCDNCIERFDHHCPWVGNCIGRRNYRRFYFFISSTSLLVLFVLLSAVVKDWAVITRRLESEGKLSSALTSMWGEAWDSLIVALFAFGMMWFVIGLWAYHTYLIYVNQTTYEHIKSYYEGDINPWDRGGPGNLHDILCTPSRPRYFDARHLSLHRVVFEPKHVEANPPVNSGTKRTTIGDRAVVCGLEICSVAEVAEAPTEQLRIEAMVERNVEPINPSSTSNCSVIPNRGSELNKEGNTPST